MIAFSMEIFLHCNITLFFPFIGHRVRKKSNFAENMNRKMRRTMLIVAAMLLLCTTSCKKTRYCRCTTIQNDEVVNLGEDFYVIEDGSRCADRAKEIVGWGQVICTEVSKAEATGEENKWWEDLFGLGGGKN